MKIAWSAHLATLADRYRDRVAVSDGEGASMSFVQLHRRAQALAAHLLASGVAPGEPIASLIPNQIEAVWVSYALKMAGVAETPLGFGLTDEELAWCARLAGFRRVVTLRTRAPAMHALGFEPIDPLPDADCDSAPGGPPLAPVEGAVDGRILFTSGTTGKPKGVVYTHEARRIGEQMQQAAWPIMPRAGDRLLLMTPFVHGASLLAFGWLDHGGEVLLHAGVDLPALRAEFEQASLSAVFAPPTVLARITAGFEGQCFGGVRCIFTGTQPLTESLYRRAQAMFGPVVRVTYGKSECINPITVLAPDETDHWFDETDRAAGACVGWPAPGVELHIGPPAGATGEPDEIWLRAPQMSKGLILPERGFTPHEPEGWHATGDLGFIDARGRLMLTGRMADVIKTGGYRVNPDEIESLLGALLNADGVCITSLASDHWGEVIVAVAEGAREGWIDEATARVQSLSRHKHPRLWVSLAALPRNAQGKVSRREAARAVLETHELIDGRYPQIQIRTQP